MNVAIRIFAIIAIVVLVASGVLFLTVMIGSIIESNWAAAVGGAIFALPVIALSYIIYRFFFRRKRSDSAERNRRLDQSDNSVQPNRPLDRSNNNAELNQQLNRSDTPAERNPQPDRSDNTSVPDEWRTKLLAVLASDAISEPSKAAFWKNYGALGKLALSLFSVMILLAAWKQAPDTYLAEIILAVPTVIVCWFFFAQMNREAPIHLQIKHGFQPREMLSRAAHPPVLLLRSFKFDTVSSSLPRWARWEEHTPFNVLPPEPALVGMIWRHAPVLAIGRPGEPAPPLGAVRFYVRQDAWQQTVQTLIGLCQLVIWTTGDTEGLHWEITHLLESVTPERLLLWVHVHITEATRSDREHAWKKFLQHYSNVFPKPPLANVEHVRFIAFEKDWTPIGIPGPGYRPSVWEVINSLPRNYGLESFLRRRLH